MSDQEEDERPLPKGTYNFNFDEFDENMDPFKSSKGLMNSPTKDMPNPFQSSSKLSSSPPLPTLQNNIEEVNPFQTKTKLGSSPPQNSMLSQEVLDSESIPNHTDRNSNNSSPVETPIKAQKGLKTRAKSQTPPTPVESETCSDIQREIVPEDPPVKPPEPAKSPQKKKLTSGLKKPKAKSKFKRPVVSKPQNADVDVIFSDMPPPPSQQEMSDMFDTASDTAAPIDNSVEPNVVAQTSSVEPDVAPQAESVEPDVVAAADNVDTDLQQNSETVSKETELNNVSQSVSHVQEVENLPYMMDSVHDFGAAEMPIDNNEGTVLPSEAFNEDHTAWEMSQEDPVSAERESPCDPEDLSEQVPDKVTTTVRRSSDPDHIENNSFENEDISMTTQPQSKPQSSRGVARNPAARALQEQVDGDRGRRADVQVIDKTIYGQDGQRAGDGVEERYFDAPEYPLSSRKAHMQAERDVEQMNETNKKHGSGSGETNKDIVQLVQVLKYSQSDWNKMKQELELDFNARLLNKEREWSKKLADRDKKITYLDEQVLLLRSANDDMKAVVAEFEKTISQLQAEKERKTTESLQSYEDVVKERDQALEDLQSVETAFSDLHQRYERTKGVVEGFKKNEDVLKKCVQDYQVKLKAAEEKTHAVRQQAEDKLHLASDEMEKLRKSTTAEVARLEAALKKSDLKIQGLDRSLEQKVRENDELTAICDELIAKVGGE